MAQEFTPHNISNTNLEPVILTPYDWTKEPADSYIRQDEPEAYPQGRLRKIVTHLGSLMKEYKDVLSEGRRAHHEMHNPDQPLIDAKKLSESEQEGTIIRMDW